MTRLFTQFVNDPLWIAHNDSQRRAITATTNEASLQTSNPTLKPEKTIKSAPNLQLVRERQQFAATIKAMVASRMFDRYHAWPGIAANNEIKELYNAYQLIETLFTTPAMLAPLDRLTRGGASRGFKFEFSAKRKDDRNAIYKADKANDICSAPADMLNGTGWGGLNSNFLKSPYPNPTLGDISARLGKYCNQPIHLQWDSRNNLKQLSVMPPWAWKINTGPDLNFIKAKDPLHPKKDEMNFLVYDPGNGFTLDEGYMAENISWGFANRAPSDRYGQPLGYNLSIYVYTLNELYKGLDQARKMGNPQTVYLAEENIAQSELQELLDSMPQQMAALGYDLGAMSNAWNKILHHVKDAKTLSAGTGAFQEFNDENLLRSTIAMAFNMQPALMFGAEKAGRNTLAFLMRLESTAQRIWMLQVIVSIILATFQKCLYMAGYETTRDLNCNVMIDEDKTPEEMEAEGKFALDAMKQGVISEDGARQKACSYTGLDPKQEKERIDLQNKTSNNGASSLSDPNPDNGIITDNTDPSKEFRMQKFNERRRDGMTNNEALHQDKIDVWFSEMQRWNRDRERFESMMRDKMGEFEERLDSLGMSN